MTRQIALSKRINESAETRNEVEQWAALIGNLLERLELDAEDRADAEVEYKKLANDLAGKLSIPRHDVHIFPQGSMRTQTTISQRYPAKFDLDLVVKLTGPKYNNPDSEQMFSDVGDALEGNEAVTGEATAKRRCWRLPYPNKRYYFDLTPAVADRTGLAGSNLSVRDPDTVWAPSNPEEFADWFCTHAGRQFPFQMVFREGRIEARTTVDPLPTGKVALDDILRRAVQLMKLHRDTFYWNESPKRKESMPISVILVTLATHAYDHLATNRAGEFSSPIEVVLALIEAMPQFIDRLGGLWWVANPKLPLENFADKWNSDNGARYAEFCRWHEQLEVDLEALLYQSHRTPSEEKIRGVFGQAGVEAWKASKPPSVLDGIIATAPGNTRTNPERPLSTGSSNTVA